MRERMLRGTYFVRTFGCQMNVHDSDRIGEVLRADGWVEAETPEAAELVLVNTCSVREKAEQKLRSEVGRLVLLRQRRPNGILVVTGCVAQQEGDALLRRFAEIDLVVGPDNLLELPALLQAQRAGAPPTVRTAFDGDAPRFLAARPEPGRVPVSAYVTTMKGCDERCSFCIVPTTRGPERYRPAREILAEAERLVDAGAREIVLLGQTVDSYRDPALALPTNGDPDRSQFPDLLRALAARVPGLLRLRYTSPHPRHATVALARAHTDLDVLARHVHLPVQSGSNRVLRRMIRRYTREEYVVRALRLKASRPGMTLSTDVIVGFPGETAEDFEATLSLVREVKFVSIFAFKYSPRPGTPALDLDGAIAEDEKSERLARLFELQDSLSRAHLSSLVGTRQRVLVAAGAEGRTERSEIVHIVDPGTRNLVGRLVDVEIVRANEHSLAARLVDPAAFPSVEAPELPGNSGDPSNRAPAHIHLKTLR